MTALPKRSLRSGLQRLLERSGKEVAKKPRTTVAHRKAQLLADLEDFNVDRLVGLQQKMGAFIDLITLNLGDELVLDEGHAYTLMSQALGVRDIKEFMDVCHGRVKEYLFDHLNAIYAEQGLEDPENTNGSLEVPALGMKFCREGTGVTDPSVNDTLLKKALGSRWEEVYDIEVIPEQRVYTLNTEALWDMVKNDPDLMEAVRGALEPGVPKNGRMVIRNM
jgi:hypothetical protein